MTQQYKLTDELVLFAQSDVEKFDGMLNKSASIGSALLTHILGVDYGWEGKAFLEIGVYKGKFLAVIERATRPSNALIIGVDPFQISGQDFDSVEKSLKEGGLEMDRVRLHKGFSSEKSAIENLVGDRPLMMVHIDGSHQAKDVYADMHFADEIIHDDGIIITDDFWNRHALGIISATARAIIEDKIGIEPFALLNTKLLWCRKGRSDEFKIKFAEAMRANTQIAMFQNFIQKYDHDKAWLTRSEFMGHEIFVI